MGNKNSAGNSDSSAPPPPFRVLPDVPVPSLKPSNLNFAATTGKPILCAGWVAPHGNPGWSRHNVTYSSDIRVPAPGPNQVRVKIYAAGVNPADAHRTAVLPGSSLVPVSGRSTHTSRRPRPLFEFPYTVGIEGAGVIESVGWAASLFPPSQDGEETLAAVAPAHPSGLCVGDRVAFLADFTRSAGGTFCQYAVVDADIVWRLPELTAAPAAAQQQQQPPVPGRLIDFVEAATLPVAGSTAYAALFDKLRIEPQRTIFISGASGGVGSIAVQLAHYFGLYVIATCSTPNVRYVQDLGADLVVDYTRTDVVKEILKHTDGYGVDYLLECAGASMAEAHAETVRFGGALCVLTGLLTPCSSMLFRRQLSVHYLLLGMQHQDKAARKLLQPLGQLVLALYAQGAFSVKTEQVPFVQATEALDVVASAHGRGKIVLTSYHMNEDQEERQRRRRMQVYEKAQRQAQAEEMAAAEAAATESATAAARGGAPK